MNEEEAPPEPGLAIRDGSRFVAVFVALLFVVAVGMIALRLQTSGHTDMGGDTPDDMPTGSH